MTIENADVFFAQHGFTVWQTGGGCTAYGLKLSEDGSRYILITGDETCACPIDQDEVCSVYFYDEGEHYNGDGGEAEGFAAAVALAKDLAQKHND